MLEPAAEFLEHRARRLDVDSISPGEPYKLARAGWTSGPADGALDERAAGITRQLGDTPLRVRKDGAHLDEQLALGACEQTIRTAIYRPDRLVVEQA